MSAYTRFRHLYLTAGDQDTADHWLHRMLSEVQPLESLISDDLAHLVPSFDVAHRSSLTPHAERRFRWPSLRAGLVRFWRSWGWLWPALLMASIPGAAAILAAIVYTVLH